MHRSFFIYLGAEEISKLSIADLGISISVDSADNREDLSVDQASTKLPQKVLYVYFSDLTDTKSVETSKCGLWSVIRLVLQLLNEILHALYEVDFMLDYIIKATFNVV